VCELGKLKFQNSKFRAGNPRKARIYYHRGRDDEAPSSQLLPDARQRAVRKAKRAQRTPEGSPLAEKEWIELMNKYDRLNRYAKKRRGKEKG
jgi:hypothetical protein